MKTITFLMVGMLFAGWVNLQAKNVYYVKAGGVGNGTSWNNASGDIQSMIDKASAGDEVWVAAGTYRPTEEQVSFAPKNGVDLYGGFLGSEASIDERKKADVDGNGYLEAWEFTNETVLRNCVDADGYSHSEPIIECKQAFAQETRIDGFTIFGGGWASGIHNKANTIINNCIVRNCSTGLQQGGGIYNEGGTVSNCKVIDNTVWVSSSVPSGGLHACGGGIFNESIPGSMSGIVKNCVVYGNYVYCNNSGGGGSRATAYGGGIANSGGVVINCCVTNNTVKASRAGYGEIRMYGSGIASGNVHCSTVLNNEGGENLTSENTLSNNCTDETFDKSNFINPTLHTGRIDTDQFPDNGKADWHLKSGSQYIDAGNAEDIPDWIIEIINGTDLAGNPRIHNGKIDLGALEYNGSQSGIKELLPANVTVFFNSTTGSVMISGLQGDETLRLYNINGNLLFSRKASSETETVSVGHLPSGVYFLKTNAGQVLKWIKK